MSAESHRSFASTAGTSAPVTQHPPSHLPTAIPCAVCFAHSPVPFPIKETRSSLLSARSFNLTPPYSARPRTLPSSSPPTLSTPFLPASARLLMPHCPRYVTARRGHWPPRSGGAGAEVGPRMRSGRSLPPSSFSRAAAAAAVGPRGAVSSRSPRPPGRAPSRVRGARRAGSGAGRGAARRAGRPTGLKGTGAARTQARRPTPPRASPPGSASEGSGLQPRPPPSRAPERPGRGEPWGGALRRCGRAGRPRGRARCCSAGRRKRLRRRAQGPGTARSAPFTAGSGPRGAPSAPSRCPQCVLSVRGALLCVPGALLLVYFRTAGRRAALREGVPASGSGAALCGAGTLTAAGVRGFLSSLSNFRIDLSRFLSMLMVRVISIFQ